MVLTFKGTVGKGRLFRTVKYMTVSGSMFSGTWTSNRPAGIREMVAGGEAPKIPELFLFPFT